MKKILYAAAAAALFAGCSAPKTAPSAESTPTAVPADNTETIKPEIPFSSGLLKEEDADLFLAGKWAMCINGMPYQEMPDAMFEFVPEEKKAVFSYPDADESVTLSYSIMDVFDIGKGTCSMLEFIPEETSAGFLLNGGTLSDAHFFLQVLAAQAEGKDLLAMREIGNGSSQFAAEGLRYETQTSDQFWVFERESAYETVSSEVNDSWRRKDSTFYAFLWKQSSTDCLLQEMSAAEYTEDWFGEDVDAVWYEYPENGHALQAVRYEYAFGTLELQDETYEDAWMPALLRVTTDSEGKITALEGLEYLNYGIYRVQKDSILYVDWADECTGVWMKEYEAELPGENGREAIFYVIEPVRDFRIHTLLPSEKGGYLAEPLYELDSMDLSMAVRANLSFPGDLSAFGVSFTDEEGNEHWYSIYLSGKDGSLMVSEE